MTLSPNALEKARQFLRDSFDLRWKINRRHDISREEKEALVLAAFLCQEVGEIAADFEREAEGFLSGPEYRPLWAGDLRTLAQRLRERYGESK